MGLIPGAMEDKWFLYLEDNKFYCHQSWTGYCAYIVEFAPCEEGYRAEAFLAPMEQTRDGWAAAAVKALVAFLAEDYARQTRYALLMEQLATPLGTMDTTGLPLYTIFGLQVLEGTDKYQTPEEKLASTEQSDLMAEAVRSGLCGVCVVDALGVPAEFRSRESLDADPVTKYGGRRSPWPAGGHLVG